MLAAAFCVSAFHAVCGAEPAKGPQPRKLRVVVFGAHCDDPESAAGGLIALLTRSGHEVICAYATSFRGDRKFFGRPEAEVRQAGSTAACKILGATTKFFPYAHEKLVADEATVKEVSAWFDEIKPDIVITHWPLDTHPNHHATSSIVWQCYRRPAAGTSISSRSRPARKAWPSIPSCISTSPRFGGVKQQANLCFKSQNPEDDFWPMHEQMHRDRGVQCGVP